MTYKELFYFTGRCLSLDEHPEFREEVTKQLLASQQDLDNFIQLCSDHLIIPVIYLKFKAYKILKHLPEEYVQALKEIYDLNCQRNEQILRQIDEIAAELNKENIQPVFLKGTANLLDGLYSDVGERMIGDIDFLVKEDDYLRAAQLLEAYGYKRQDNNYFNIFRFKHYPVLTKEGEPTYLEIHRLPVDQKYEGSLNSELIYRKKRDVPGKQGIFVPSDEDKLIHTFIHSQLADQGHEYMLADFRVLNDLYRLSKRLDVSILVLQTNYQNEATSWLATGRRLLNIPELCPIETKQAQKYVRKFDWNLNHLRTYQALLFLKKIFHTVFMRYGIGFIQLFYLKEQRISVYKRLIDFKWYKIHMQSIKKCLL